MKKILCVVDVRDWAYDDAAKNWQELLKDEYEIEILYLSDYKPIRATPAFFKRVKDIQNGTVKDAQNLITESWLFEKNETPIFDHKKYDGIYIFYHRALSDTRLLATPIPYNKLAVAINNEKWVADGAGDTYERLFKGARVLSVCNAFVESKFKPYHPNVMRVSQTINEEVFYKTREKFSLHNKSFRIGWSGNYNNPYKNYKMVASVIEKSGSRLFRAKDLSREELNLWYAQLNTTLCLSQSEGGPLMLLESGACGVPIITAPVGLAREIVKHKETGIIVPRDEDAIVKAVEELRDDRDLREYMAINLHKEIHENWTYKSRLYEIRNAFKEITSK